MKVFVALFLVVPAALIQAKVDVFQQDASPYQRGVLWTPYSTTKLWFLAATEGVIITVRYNDGVGNTYTQFGDQYNANSGLWTKLTYAIIKESSSSKLNVYFVNIMSSTTLTKDFNTADIGNLWTVQLVYENGTVILAEEDPQYINNAGFVYGSNSDTEASDINSDMEASDINSDTEASDINEDLKDRPVIKQLSSTTQNITIMLKPSELHDDTTTVNGYMIYFMPEFSGWEAIQIPGSTQTYTLKGLWCGSQYQIFAKAYNKTVNGEPSETLNTRTKGNKPEIPEVHRFVEAYSNSITLDLNAWGDGGCPFNYFAIEYKSRSQVNWTMVSETERTSYHQKVRPVGNFVIMDLTPATWYSIRISSRNNAGSSVAVYDSATLTATGATIKPIIASNSSKGGSSELRYEDGAAYYTMGEHTLKVPMTLHKENRERLVKRLQDRGGFAPGSIVLLQGGEDTYRSGSGDVNHVFRQESYFHWAFGVLEPGWYGAIDVSTGKTMLFMPRLPHTYAMWMGHIRTPEEYLNQYQVDEVYYVDQMAQFFMKIITGELLTLNGINTDSRRDTIEASFEGISQFTVNNRVLHDEIAECRVHKTKAEIQILRYAASVSCAAHRVVMRRIRPGMKEYQLEAMFKHHTYYNGGCRHQGYTNICGSGPNAAVLHYGHAGAPNDRTIKDGDAIMLDMGAEYYSYTSDVSVSYPASGKFSNDHKNIYNAVYAAHQAVMTVLRPGVSWVEMHRLAYRAMLEKLKEAGLVQGGIDEMMAANIGSVFMPHGLGHLLGIDVHDVGGYLEGHPSRPTEEGYSKLRTARIIEENMVLTVEPGCYFIDSILDGALTNPELARFLVHEEIERFRGFGGVRIEDDVLVTANGIENLSHEIPRTVEAIEALMAAGRREDVDVP